jgi:hypothetical protein
MLKRTRFPVAVAGVLVAVCAGLEGQAPSRSWSWTEAPIRGAATLELTRIGSVVSSSGRLAVTQPDDGAVLLFDQSGDLVARVGRRGEGPGEFRSGWLARQSSELIMVSDPVLRRVTMLDWNGKVKRTFSVPQVIYRLINGRREEFRALGVFPQAVLPDGGYVMDIIPAGSSTARWISNGEDPGTGVSIVTDSSGQFRSAVLVHPTPNRECNIEYASMRSIPVPYCESALMVHGPRGDRHAVVVPSPQNQSRATVTIRMYSLSTVPLYVRELEFSRIPVARWRADSSRTLLRSRLTGNREALAAVERMKIPEFMPVVRKAVISDNDWLWLELRNATGGSDWVALDSSGEFRSRVALPTGLTVHAVSGMAMFAVRTTSSGEETLVRIQVEQ